MWCDAKEGGQRIEKSVKGYINSLTTDDQLALIQSGATYYYHKDSLGTVTDLTDSTGAIVQTYQYDSYGNIIGMSGSIVRQLI